MSVTTAIKQRANATSRPGRVPGQRRFFLWMAVALAAAVLWGFGPTYFFRAFVTTRELTPLIHLHGFVFTCWIALFVVQTALISRRQPSLHRRLGAMAMVLAAAVVVTGVMVELRMPWTDRSPRRSF